MAIRTRALTAGTILAILVAVAVVLLGESRAQEPRGIRTDCARQSSAHFPGAYRDPRNLVAGPLALIGGATFTDAATVRRFGGNKFPLLVRAGHTVTVSLPRSERQVVSLGYGALPQGEVRRRDGHPAVTFEACSAAESRSTADGPVTFWSGFVMTDRPRCVALDILVDGEAAPLRRRIELGRRCAKPAPLRDCASRAEGGRPLSTTPRSDDIVVGAIRFAGLRRIASRREFKLDRSGRVYGVKSGALVPAGVRATLSIGRAARGWAALDYSPRLPGEPSRTSAAVRFQACRAEQPAFSYEGSVGPITGFPGGFRLKHGGCVPVEVRVSGRPTARARISFGVGRRC